MTITYSWLRDRLKSTDGDTVDQIVFTRSGTDGGNTATRCVVWVVPDQDRKPRSDYTGPELDSMREWCCEQHSLDAEIALSLGA